MRLCDANRRLDCFCLPANFPLLTGGRATRLPAGAELPGAESSGLSGGDLQRLVTLSKRAVVDQRFMFRSLTAIIKRLRRLAIRAGNLRGVFFWNRRYNWLGLRKCRHKTTQNIPILIGQFNFQRMCQRAFQAALPTGPGVVQISASAWQLPRPVNLQASRGADDADQSPFRQGLPAAHAGALGHMFYAFCCPVCHRYISLKADWLLIGPLL